jgi:hypothetical protein
MYVQGNDLVLIVETQEYLVVGNNGLKQPVKLHQVLIQRIIPYRNPGRILYMPLKI